MTKFTWSWLGMLLLAFSLTTFTACDDDDEIMEEEGLFDFIEDNQQYSLFRDALDEADLINNIRLFSGESTFFVPNNTAMTNFLQANNFADLEAVPDDLLEATLRNHIIRQDYRAAELQTGYYATNNDVKEDDVQVMLYLNTDNGVVINGNVNVTTADLITDDGVVHEVDRVIMPPSVVTFASADANFSTLLAAIQKVDTDGSLTTMLSGLDNGPFTILAPTNAAFQALLDSNPDWNSLDDIDASTLTSVLLYHVIEGDRLRSSEIGSDPVTTQSGATLSFTRNGDTVTVVAGGNNATVVAADVIAENGVIHAIDTVLLPQ